MAVGAWLLGAALASGFALAATAQDSPAKAAFDASDYSTAWTLWEQSATKDGAPEAMLQLGLMADRGLGQPRDPAKAFGWYMKAAEAGLAEAQLNVAVMLDAGIGTTRDPEAAFIWYSRAALRGSGRAQYNLGLLLEAGVGTPANAALAQVWFDIAKTAVPAAADKLNTPRAAQRAAGLSAPEPVFSRLTDWEAEVIWRAGPAPESAHYIVDVAELAEDLAGVVSPVLSITTRRSGLLMRLPNPHERLVWRVSLVDDAAHEYASSDWQNLPDGTPPPRGVAMVAMDRQNAQADLLADLLRADLAQSQVSVALLDNRPLTQDRTRLTYGYHQDASLARGIADLLPALGPQDIVFTPVSGQPPGEVGIDLITVSE